MCQALVFAAIVSLACSRTGDETSRKLTTEPSAREVAAASGSGPPAPSSRPVDASAPVQSSPAPAPPATRRIEITVNEAGFSPREVKVKKGEPATLVFTRVAERTCMTAIDIPAENVKKLELPLNQPIAVTITPAKAGVEAFHCNAMAMGNGRIVVEE